MVEIGPADRQEERKKGCEDRGTGEDVGDDGDGNVGSVCDGGVDGEWIGLTGLFASDEEDLRAIPDAAVVMAAKRMSNRLRKRHTPNPGHRTRVHTPSMHHHGLPWIWGYGWLGLRLLLSSLVFVP